MLKLWRTQKPSVLLSAISNINIGQRQFSDQILSLRMSVCGAQAKSETHLALATSDLMGSRHSHFPETNLSG